MAELLLELRVEEIPANAQAKAATMLGNLLKEKCTLLPDIDLKTFHTPRRLIVCLQNLPLKIPASVETRKGPGEHAPPQAIAGFLQANKITLQDCTLEPSPTAKDANAQSWFFRINKPEILLSEILPEWINDAISHLSFAKSMRFTAGNFRFIRPLRAIMAIFNNNPLSGKFTHSELCLHYSHSTIGHYMLDNRKIYAKNFSDYQEKMRDHHVIIDAFERQKMIADAMNADAVSGNYCKAGQDALLREVANLVEYPKLLQGIFAEKFLKLPDFVIASVLNYHQKHFVLQKSITNDTTTNRFMFVANGDRKQNNEQVIKGNQRVLSARLKDAAFFIEKDLQQPIKERLNALEHQIFHQNLGSMAQRICHITALAEYLCDFTNIAGEQEKSQVKSCAQMIKNDLPSLIVGEFPELQGKIGGFYADKTGENPLIAQAIATHYLPQRDDDDVPTDSLTVTLALADKMILLVGFFAIKQRPTGSKDPYALRRAATGIMRILHANHKNMRLPLRPFIAKAFALWNQNLAEKDEICQEILDFIIERQQVFMKNHGFRYDFIDAIFIAKQQTGLPADELVQLQNDTNILQKFILETPQGENLLAGCKRVSNLIRTEAKKRKVNFQISPEIYPINPKLFTRSQEKELCEIIQKFSKFFIDPNRNFQEKLQEIANSRPVIDDFFCSCYH